MIKNRTDISNEKLIKSINKTLRIANANWIVFSILTITLIIINILFSEKDYILYVNIMFSIVLPSMIISNIFTYRRASREKKLIPDKIVCEYTFKERDFTALMIVNNKNKIDKVRYDDIFNCVTEDDILIIRTMNKTIFGVDLNKFESEEDKEDILKKLNGEKKNG